MKKQIIFFSIFIIIIIASLIFFNQKEIREVCINEKCFDVEIADDDKERAKGLMFRDASNFQEDKGMLFIFPREDKYNFWMKDTLIALDLIWINADKKIIFIEKNVQPCIISECEIYSPNENALYVLELNGGKIEKFGINVGDYIRFK